MVEVGGPFRFVSMPSSARCRDRKASFSHEFMRRSPSLSRVSFRSLWNNLLEPLWKLVNTISKSARAEMRCDVVLVDRDGRPHRLVQVVPLIVSAYKVVKCCKRIEGDLKDEGDLQTRLPVGTGTRSMMDWHALRRVEATAVSASPEELTPVTDASDPRFAAGVSTAPLLPDAAYIGLVLPRSPSTDRPCPPLACGSGPMLS